MNSRPPTLTLSRRATLTLLGAGLALGAAGLPRPARANAAAPALMGDGYLELTNGFVFPDTPPDAVAAAFAAPADTPLHLPCTVPMLRVDDRVVLFDAGSGPNFMPSAGKLTQALEAAGVTPDQITDIIFTHGHPDHLWGVTDDFDDLTFPNAALHMRDAELAFWTDPATVDAMPEATKAFAVGAAARLDRVADQMTGFADGAELLPGIEAMATPGHTPGHTSFVLHLGGDPVMLTGDVISHQLTVAHPDWRWGTDQDPAQASATRRKMLDRLAHDKLRALVFHMDPAAPGRVEAADGGWRWVEG